MTRARVHGLKSKPVLLQGSKRLPETPDALDQRGVIVRVGVGGLVPYAVWRQALDLALAALEMPGIVVVLGPADVGRTFLRELMAGLRERGRAVTFVSRADFVRWWPADNALVIEDAAQMDAVLLEGICRPPGRRIVLAGLPASALAELPAPLIPAPLTVVTFESLSPATAAALRSSMSKTPVAIESGVLASALAKLPASLTPAPLAVVTLEPLSPGTATAPRSSSRSNARVAIASGVLAATGVAGGLLWTRAPRAPPAPAPSHAALQPAVELPPAPGSPSAPPETAPSASEQPGEATSASSPPAGERTAQVSAHRSNPLPRPSLDLGAAPRARSGALAGPESRQALNVPPAAAITTPPLAEAPRATPPEPAARGRVTALQPTIELPPASGSPSAPWASPEKPSPKLVQAEAGIGCPPRDTFENAQAWVHERLKCERHPTPNGLWIEWAEYCPSGPLGYFVLKVKTGQQKVYLFENIPPAVWRGVQSGPLSRQVLP